MICFCNRPTWRRKRRIFRKVLALVCLTALVNTRENTLGLFSRNRAVEFLSGASIAYSDLPLCPSWDGTQTPNSGLRHPSFSRQVPESGVRSVDGTVSGEFRKTDLSSWGFLEEEHS